MTLKEIKAWKWKCPFCHDEGLCLNHDKADIELREHIAFCYKNPLIQHCGSCIHSRVINCLKYKQSIFRARSDNHDAHYNCYGWECKPHLKKIQDKLRGNQ